MATEEARKLLDSLMGGDRNALLPKGAAVPPSKRQKRGANNSNSSSSSTSVLLLPGKRQKSCYDKDIDPLFTAWGVDVYDLFINTKSDLGTNPSVVDDGAHEEFIKLPAAEQDRLGYHYFLFQKLQELVRQCDRTISRNKEKLQQEWSRKLAQRGVQDFVEDVDEGAVESLARAMLQMQDLQRNVHEKISELQHVMGQEDHALKELETLLGQQKRRQQQQQQQKQHESNAADAEQKDDAGEAEGSELDGKNEEPQSSSPPDGVSDRNSMEEKDEPSAPEKDEPSAPEGGESTSEAVDSNRDGITSGGESSAEKSATAEKESQLLNFQVSEGNLDEELPNIQLRLGNLTLRKQRILFDLARLVTRLCPMQDAVETQHRHLNYVKSDISTDKTVCEVSGNFMSARDADERIAAHYAGKQYVGWKLVRDKFQEMQKKYGRYGPLPPTGPPGGGRGPSTMMDDASGRGGGAGGPPNSSAYGRPGGSGPMMDRSGRDNRPRGGRFDGGGGGAGFRGGTGDRGRWERNGPPPDFSDRRRGSWRR